MNATVLYVITIGKPASEYAELFIARAKTILYATFHFLHCYNPPSPELCASEPRPRCYPLHLKATAKKYYYSHQTSKVIVLRGKWKQYEIGGHIKDERTSSSKSKFSLHHILQA